MVENILTEEQDEQLDAEQAQWQEDHPGRSKVNLFATVTYDLESATFSGVFGIPEHRIEKIASDAEREFKHGYLGGPTHTPGQFIDLLKCHCDTETEFLTMLMTARSLWYEWIRRKHEPMPQPDIVYYDARGEITDAPAHLRDDADYIVCSDCGRKSYGGDKVGALCGMPSPSGAYCSGRFEHP